MSEVLDYSDIKVREVTVIAPDGKTYTLREATGEVASAHRNAIIASTQIVNGKVVGIKNTDYLEAKYIAGCLWNEHNRNPHYKVVASWPDRVQRELYDKAQELSGVGEEESIGKALRKVLSREDSPISFDELGKWVLGLKEQAGDDKSVATAIRVFTAQDDESEEELKNS